MKHAMLHKYKSYKAVLGHLDFKVFAGKLVR